MPGHGLQGEASDVMGETQTAKHAVVCQVPQERAVQSGTGAQRRQKAARECLV